MAAFFAAFWTEWRSRAWAYGAVVLVSILLSFVACLLLDQRDALRRHVASETSDIAWIVFLANHADRPSI
ncbi:MAG TPA: hypothetical protein P5079_11720 [Elusimicrobiota bacterium]|nr:hypothetical protein [Elusimicrobiota bacterium]